MKSDVADSLSILGTQVGAFDSPDAVLELIRRRIMANERTFCVAINPEKVYRARHDSRLRNILESADVRICDGVGISLAAMLLHRRPLPRCTGIDLFLRLVQLSVGQGWNVFLLGASPQSNAAACRALMNQHRGLRIVGNRSGYFKTSAEVVAEINESQAELLFVALGSPRQEFWISENMPALKPVFLMGIGGSLDVVGGMSKRAPLLFQKTGTEWAFRLLSKPMRLVRQKALPLFMMDVLKEMIAARKTRASLP